MRDWITKRPWIWIILVFIGFVSLWAWFVVFAIRNAPETVPLPGAQEVEAHES